MEIQKWLCCIFVNCVFIASSAAKSVSLNELITAESQQKDIVDTAQTTKSSGSAAKSVSLNELITAPSQRKEKVNKAQKEFHTRFSDSPTAKRYSLSQRLASKLKGLTRNSGITNPGDKKVSLGSLKIRKTFKIPSPLRPKRLNFGQKLRHQRKSQSIKREINQNEKLKQKNFPLLKSLSMLFDNLLNSDERDSYELKTKKYKRYRYYTDELFDADSQYESDTGIPEREFKPQKKTTPPTRTVTTEKSTKTTAFTFRQATTTTPHPTSTPYFGVVGQNTNIPVLLPRNTFSFHRNNNGLGPRSSPTLHRNVQRDFSRDHGAHEHHTRNKKYESNAESNENDARGDPRVHASGVGHRRTTGHRNITRLTERRNTRAKIDKSKNQNHDAFRENQFETGRNEKESKISVSESSGRLRGLPSAEEVTDKSESLQSKEVHEESDDGVTHNSTSNKRLIDGSSTVTAKIQEIRTRNETMILIGNRLNVTGNEQSNNIQAHNKSPVVMIYDGYSVTSNKNGHNNLTEKSFRFNT